MSCYVERVGTFIVFWIIFFVLFGSIVWGSVITGISPMPTLPSVRRRLVRSLPADVDGSIYELGAGWGTLAFPLARRYPNCTVIAYELSWVPYLFCRLRLWWDPLPNLRILRVDFFDVSLRDAALVICYLYPAAMKRLRDKFHQELVAYTPIVTHTFSIPGWTPEFMDKAEDVFRTPIYHYRCPTSETLS